MKTRYCNNVKEARLVALVFGEPREDTIWRSTADNTVVGAQYGKTFISIYQSKAIAAGELKFPRGSQSMKLLASVMSSAIKAWKKTFAEGCIP
jgi:hypothetical protein